MEICNRCGKSVAIGSGNYVNRVPDFNTVEVRIKIGYPFPEGDYMCAECVAEKERETPHCPICEHVMEQIAGLVTCTNPKCPNYKGMAA